MLFNPEHRAVQCLAPWIALGLTIGIGVGHSKVCAQQLHNEQLKKQFLQQAPREWADYLRFVKRLQSTTSNNTSGHGKGIVKSAGILKQAPDAALLIHQQKTPKTSAIVQATNSKYCFYLRRENETNGWVITNLILKKNAYSDYEKTDKLIKKTVVQSLAACLELDTLWLPTMIGSENFQINQVFWVSPKKRDLVKIVFSHSGKMIPGTLHITGGWMILNRKKHWLVDEYEVFYKNLKGYRRHTKLIFRQVNDKYVLAGGNVRFTTNGPAGRQAVPGITNFKVNIEDRPNVSINEFTLSAFGLPEPPRMESRATPWYIWGGGIAIACLVGGAFFYWLRRVLFA